MEISKFWTPDGNLGPEDNLELTESLFFPAPTPPLGFIFGFLMGRDVADSLPKAILNL